MGHGIEGPKEFDLFKDVRKKKLGYRVLSGSQFLYRLSPKKRT